MNGIPYYNLVHFGWVPPRPEVYRTEVLGQIPKLKDSMRTLPMAIPQNEQIQTFIKTGKLRPYRYKKFGRASQEAVDLKLDAISKTSQHMMSNPDVYPNIAGRRPLNLK